MLLKQAATHAQTHASTHARTRRACSAKASNSFIPSSRRNQVLHPEALEMYASQAGVASLTAQPQQQQQSPSSRGSPVTGLMLQLDREVENAEDSEEFCETVIRHHEQFQLQHNRASGGSQQSSSMVAPPLYSPRTLKTALLKLTDWETDSNPTGSNDYDEALAEPNAYDQARALEILQSGVVAACMQGAPSEDAAPDWATQSVDQEASIPTQPVDSMMMANYLWSLATLHGADSQQLGSGASQRRRAGLCEVCNAVGYWAHHNFNQHSQQKQATSLPDLTCMLWGYAALLQLASSPSTQASPKQDYTVSGSEASSRAGDFIDALAGEMAHRLHNSETGRDLQPADCADTAWALQVSGHRSPAVTSLAEAISMETFFQISNRNSLKAPFTAPEVIKIVVALAHLGIKSRPTLAAMDAVAGHVVKRLKSRHVSALDRPDDILTVLSAYATAGHSSVVVPELVSATAQQLITSVAGHHQWAHDHGPTDKSSSWVNKYWRLNFNSSTIAGLGRTYVRLGIYPGQILIASLALALKPQLHTAHSEQLSSLVQDLEALGHRKDKLQADIQSELARRRSRASLASSTFRL